jgi:uncharacterized protein
LDTIKETLKFKNLMALRTSKDFILGFHTENLEVARLSPEAWQSLAENQPLVELTTWSDELTSESQSPNQVSLTHKFKSITLNVNQVCNLHCVYCAAGGDGSFGDPVKKISLEKTLPQISFFLNKLTKGDAFKITFLGGEPLLYPEALQIIGDEAKKIATEKEIELKFVVVTNGTLFNEKTIPVLTMLNASVTISLDGPPEINDKLRPTKGGQGSTAQILKGLNLLLENKDKLNSIGFSGVFGARNMELEKAFRFYSEFGVDWFDFVYDHLETSSEVSQKYTKGMKHLAKLAFEKGGETELRKIRQFDTYFQILDSQVKNQNYCGTGNSYLMIDAQNNMYVCPWSVGKKEDLVGSGVTIFEDKLAEYSATLVEQNNCGQCWAKNVCGGGCQFIHKTNTGDKRTVDKNFCERTRDLIAQTLMYYEQSRNKTGSSNHQI